MGSADKQKAVGITVTLSSQLIAAALAVLAVEGAFAAYALAERSVRPEFPWVISISALFFVVSIFVAGKGITEARDAGFEGSWDISVGRNKFNWQAICLVLGLLLFAIAAATSGATGKSLTDQHMLDMQTEIRLLATQVEGLEHQSAILAADVSVQRQAIDALSEQLTQLEEEVRSVVDEMRDLGDGANP